MRFLEKRVVENSKQTLLPKHNVLLCARLTNRSVYTYERTYTKQIFMLNDVCDMVTGLLCGGGGCSALLAKVERAAGLHLTTANKGRPKCDGPKNNKKDRKCLFSIFISRLFSPLPVLGGFKRI